MALLTGQKSRKQRVRFLRNSASFAGILLFLLSFIIAACGGTSGNQTRANSSVTSPTANIQAQCPTSSQSGWTPVGKTWKLTVNFVVFGPRKGQSEISIMTFLPDSHLTASFPSATPSSPPVLPDAIDGKWCMTGLNTFGYQFRDPILQNGIMVAYVAPTVNATLTSETTYTAIGIGIAYSAKTGMSLPGQSGMTQTSAIAVTS